MDKKTEKTEKQNQDFIPQNMLDDWNQFSALPLNWEKEYQSFPCNYIFYSENE